MPIIGLPNIKRLKAKGNVSGLVKVRPKHTVAIRIEAAMALGEIGGPMAQEALI